MESKRSSSLEIETATNLRATVITADEIEDKTPIDKIYIDNEAATSDEEGLQNVIKLYEAGLVQGLQTSKHSIKHVKILPNQLRAEEKEIGEVVEPQEHDFTLLEREVWDEEPRKNQIFHDTARDKWFEEECCVASALGFAMCGYSLWTFPQLCIKYGTFAFCVMYFIVTCFLTVPAIYFEISLGQFCQTGPFHAWKITPIFIGLGAAMLANTFMSVIMNNTRSVWLAFYASESFRSNFAWAFCSGDWTTSNCKDFDVSKKDLQLTELSRSPAYEFFRARVLRVWKSQFADDKLSTHPFNGPTRLDKPYPESLKVDNGKAQYDINDIGIPSLDLILLLLIIYSVGYFILKYRIRFMGAVYFCILLIGYVLVTVPFTYAWLLPRKKVGFGSFFNNANYSNFFLGVAWVAVIKHSLIATGLGTGAYILIGSHRSFSTRRIKNIAFSAGFGSWIIHCLIAVTMFMFWEEAKTYGNTGQFLNSYFGTDPVTDVFPLIIAQGTEHKLSRFYSFCFYGGLLCLSIIRTFFGIYLLKRTVMDSNKQIFDSFRIFYDPNERGEYRRWDRLRLLTDDEIASTRLLIIFLIATGLSTIVCLTRGGIYIQLFLENYCYGISFTFVFFIEAMALTYLWGIGNIDNMVRAMTGYQSTVFYRITWKFCLPGIIVLYIIHRGFIPDGVDFDGIKLPINYDCIGIVFSCVPFLFILGLGVKGIIETPVKKLTDKFKLCLAPQYQWVIIASGKLGSNRTRWMHYVNIPTGFGSGPGYPKATEEMYYSCKGCGQIFRDCWRNNCSFGIYSKNLLRLKVPRGRSRPPTPGLPMELMSTKKRNDPIVLNHIPNEKLLMIEEEDQEDKEERELDLMAKNNSLPTGGMDGDLRSKSESYLNAHKDGIPERAEIIQMSMKPGEIRRSMEMGPEVEFDSETNTDRMNELMEADENDEEKAERLKHLRADIYSKYPNNANGS